MMFAKATLSALLAVQAAPFHLANAQNNSGSLNTFIDTAQTPTGAQDITSWAVIVLQYLPQQIDGI